MKEYQNLLEGFVEQSKRILKNNLIGIYLHGSAAMGCFNSEKSDIDLLIVIRENISNKIKRQYMDMIIEINKQAPERGLEFSIVKMNVCNPFVYPTPFVLHFSVTHINWYQSDPEDYIEKMKGMDKDLAAHFTIIFYRGKKLYGKEIKDIFSQVSEADYFDSIWNDIKSAENDIEGNTMYVILNLCRVLAYKKDNLILSKKEGGEWGMTNIPEKFNKLILDAITEYQTGKPMNFVEAIAKEYARYMLAQILSLGIVKNTL